MKQGTLKETVVQDHDGKVGTLWGLVDTQIQEESHERGGWGPSLGCGEPRPSSAAVRVADEIITFFLEAKIKIRLLGRAMLGVDVVQNVKTEVNCGQGVKLVLTEDKEAGDLAFVPKTSRLVWNLFFAHDRGARFVAAWCG